MSRTLPPEDKLRLIAQLFMHDTDAQTESSDIAAQRQASIPSLQSAITAFVAGETDLDTFRHNIHSVVTESPSWGAAGTWMMNLHQLANYALKYPERAIEQRFRPILDDLNAGNLGSRIEAFRAILVEEKEQTKPAKGEWPAPGVSAFFVSLFAAWLDPDGSSLIAWPSSNEALRFLRDIGALPTQSVLQLTDTTLKMLTAEDYQTVRRIVAGLAQVAVLAPSARDTRDQRFLAWVSQHKSQIQQQLDIAEGNVVRIPVEDAPGQKPRSFVDSGVPAVPPDLLAQRIAEVRRQIFVPPAVVRRIYYALVLGQHIILSGPPGTGKTELARLLPRELWSGLDGGGTALNDSPNAARPSTQHATRHAYTVRVVTATDEWTPRHVIGGIVPIADEEHQIRYEIDYGCLARTIIDNWELDEDNPSSWPTSKRRPIVLTDGDTTEEFRGRWLIIDEFNRAPIDLAFGEALTALGGGVQALNVPVTKGTASLPIPRDFRIIGTLNTFDRHFLNQISEALKRRFTFIEILPPTRQERQSEQAMVLRKALRHLQPISNESINLDGLGWDGVLALTADSAVPWIHEWTGNTAVQRLFDEGWRLFEIIRIYRQFGTAQAISWTISYLGTGLLEGLSFEDEDGWRRSLDHAFADTLADQLQILFPDEIVALLGYLRTDDENRFAERYNAMYQGLVSPKRRTAQMLALSSIKDVTGNSYLSSADVAALSESVDASVSTSILTQLFHADRSRGRLQGLEERLERYLFERTL